MGFFQAIQLVWAIPISGNPHMPAPTCHRKPTLPRFNCNALLESAAFAGDSCSIPFGSFHPECVDVLGGPGGKFHGFVADRASSLGWGEHHAAVGKNGESQAGHQKLGEIWWNHLKSHALEVMFAAMDKTSSHALCPQSTRCGFRVPCCCHSASFPQGFAAQHIAVAAALDSQGRAVKSSSKATSYKSKNHSMLVFRWV